MKRRKLRLSVRRLRLQKRKLRTKNCLRPDRKSNVQKIKMLPAGRTLAGSGVVDSFVSEGFSLKPHISTDGS